MTQKDTPTELTEEKTRAFLERANAVHAKMEERRKLSEDIAALQRRGKKLDAELVALMDGEGAAPAAPTRAPTSSKPAPPKKTRKAKKTPSTVRSEEEIEDEATRLLNHLLRTARKYGKTAERIKEDLNYTDRSYRVPLKRLVERGDVRQEGKHRGALYWGIEKEPKAPKPRKKTEPVVDPVEDALSNGVIAAAAHAAPEAAQSPPPALPG